MSWIDRRLLRQVLGIVFENRDYIRRLSQSHIKMRTIEAEDEGDPDSMQEPETRITRTFWECTYCDKISFVKGSAISHDDDCAVIHAAQSLNYIKIALDILKDALDGDDTKKLPPPRKRTWEIEPCDEPEPEEQVT